MRKKRLASLLLIALASVFNVAVAHAQVETADTAFKAIVQVKTYTLGLDYFVQEIQTGTGTIIDPNGLVLTNAHVVTVHDNFDGAEMSTGFEVCVTKAIDTEPDCRYGAKLVAKDADKDLALLQIVPVQGLTAAMSFPYLDVAKTDGVTLDEEVHALGYPGIGGDTISSTKGVVSGKQNKFGVDWFKTDAVTSFGSSGGAVIDATGKLIGMSTAVHSDLAGTLGYAVNASSISPWIEANAGTAPLEGALLDRMATFIKKQDGRNDTGTFRFDTADFSIVRPDGWKFFYDSEDRLQITDPSDDEGGGVTVALDRLDTPASVGLMKTLLDSQLADNGQNGITQYTKNEAVDLNGTQGLHLQTSTLGTIGADEYVFTNGNIGVQLLFSYGKNEKDKTKVDGIIHSVILQPHQLPVPTDTYVNPDPLFSLKSDADFQLRKMNSRSFPAEYYDPGFTTHVTVVVEKSTQDMLNLSNEDLLTRKTQQTEGIASAANTVNLDFKTVGSDPQAHLAGVSGNIAMLEMELDNHTTGAMILRQFSYFIRTQGDFVTLAMRYIGSDAAVYQERLASFKRLANTFSLSATPGTIASQTAPPVSSVPGAAFDRDGERNAAVSINADKKLESTGSSACASGSLIKGASSAAVYYCGANGKRFVFPDFHTYSTWYANFDGVITLTDAQLASVPIGGVVTYRPGTRMIKITSDTKVYAVGSNGELRPIGSEAVAIRLYGADWNKQIDDISDAFFTNYRVGDAINE